MRRTGLRRQHLTPGHLTPGRRRDECALVGRTVARRLRLCSWLEISGICVHRRFALRETWGGHAITLRSRVVRYVMCGVYLTALAAYDRRAFGWRGVLRPYRSRDNHRIGESSHQNGETARKHRLRLSLREPACGIRSTQFPIRTGRDVSHLFTATCLIAAPVCFHRIALTFPPQLRFALCGVERCES